MTVFEVKGSFKEKRKSKGFTKTVEAVNQNFAKEKVLSLFGSKNKIRRANIKIEAVKESAN